MITSIVRSFFISPLSSILPFLFISSRLLFLWMFSRVKCIPSSISSFSVFNLIYLSFTYLISFFLFPLICLIFVQKFLLLTLYFSFIPNSSLTSFLFNLYSSLHLCAFNWVSVFHIIFFYMFFSLIVPLLSSYDLFVIFYSHISSSFLNSVSLNPVNISTSVHVTFSISHFVSSLSIYSWYFSSSVSFFNLYVAILL